MQSAYHTCEAQYLINLRISDHVKNEAARVRQFFCEKYGITHTTYKDDLLLARLTVVEAGESLLIKTISAAAREVDGFLIWINEIEPVPTHSIKIKATSKAELTSLSTSLRSIRAVARGTSEKPFFTEEFGLILLKGLSPEKYEALLPEIRSTEINYQCIVNELQLLKKNGSEWKEVKSFLLKKEDQLKQASLF